MDQPISTPATLATLAALPAPRDALDLLEELREVSAMTHAAVVGLAAMREKTPDYSETLRTMQARLDRIDQWHAHIANKPALTLTPAIMAEEFGKRAIELRAEDYKLIAEMRRDMARSIGELDGQMRNVAAYVPRALTTQAQKDRQIRCGIAGLVAGILLWSFLPGAIARALPDSWGVPQWMAERTIGDAATGETSVATSGSAK